MSRQSEPVQIDEQVKVGPGITGVEGVLEAVSVNGSMVRFTVLTSTSPQMPNGQAKAGTPTVTPRVHNKARGSTRF